MTETTSSPRKILLRKQLLEVVPFSYATIHNLMERDEFPQPVQLTRSKFPRLGWFEDEVADWIGSRERGRGRPQPAEVYAKMKSRGPRRKSVAVTAPITELPLARPRPILLPRHLRGRQQVKA